MDSTTTPSKSPSIKSEGTTSSPPSTTSNSSSDKSFFFIAKPSAPVSISKQGSYSENDEKVSSLGRSLGELEHVWQFTSYSPSVIRYDLKPNICNEGTDKIKSNEAENQSQFSINLVDGSKCSLIHTPLHQSSALVDQESVVHKDHIPLPTPSNILISNTASFSYPGVLSPLESYSLHSYPIKTYFPPAKNHVGNTNNNDKSDDTIGNNLSRSNKSDNFNIPSLSLNPNTICSSIKSTPNIDTSNLNISSSHEMSPMKYFASHPLVGPSFNLLPEFSAMYTLIEPLGEGGTAFVLSGIRILDRLSVAVKFIFKDKIPANGWKRDRGLGKIVPIEVFILRRLNHKNIVKFYDVFEDSTVKYSLFTSIMY